MNTRFKGILAAALMLLLFAANLMANNIQVSNVNLFGQNTSLDYTLVQFDLTWENSWRTTSAPNNWDAAWVFVKYRVGTGNWQHAWLSTSNSDHSVGINNGVAATITAGNTNISGTDRGMGAFLFRTNNGTGAINWQTIQLRWNYGANGVADDATVDVQVFAIEMVYVPEGAFRLGSGGTETSAFYRYPSTTNTFQIISENAISVGTGTDNLYYSSTSGGGDQGGPIPQTFPKGFNGFYCMKYEISQQQYVDFLSTLTSTQAVKRSSGSSGNRYGITVSGGVYSTTNPYVACNWLTWMDGAAYADWSGLRPMTELEFEKACRGTLAPVANEYAWGTTSATAATGISNPGATNETASNSGANAAFANSGTGGPLRVGVFANGSSTRAQSGASYWGIMELSCNLYERPVTIGNVAGRSFTGLHGNGVLNSPGDADVDYWPGINDNNTPGTANGTYNGTTGVTQSAGSGFRGGTWFGSNAIMPVSDRFSAAVTFTYRSHDYGFRGVRSIP